MRTEQPRTPPGVTVDRSGFVRRVEGTPPAEVELGRVLSVSSGWAPTAYVPYPGRPGEVNHVCLKTRRTRRKALFAIVAMRDGDPFPQDCDRTHLLARTDGMVVDQTNRLAHQLYKLLGYETHPEFLFWRAERSREQQAWEMARAAQLELTATDPDDALANMGWEKTW